MEAAQRLEELEAFVARCWVWEVSYAVAWEASQITGELAARGGAVG
jgi:hypothetical protein